MSEDNDLETIKALVAAIKIAADAIGEILEITKKVLPRLSAEVNKAIASNRELLNKL